MRKPLPISPLVGVALLTAAVSARAQSPTSASIGGRVLDREGRALQGADVAMTSQVTGFALRATTRADGRYLIRGLDVGGPYTLTVRRIGWPKTARSGLVLSLGQQLQVDVTLDPEAVTLQAMDIGASPNREFSSGRTGVEVLLGDSVLHHLPVLNRDLYDLVRLVPQMSTWFAVTAVGAGPRANSIRIDGVTDQVPSSNLAAGQLYGGKVIPLDAVTEYRVSISPYDVQQGSFAGAGVNVATRSGTNAFHGSVFGYGTNERLGPNVPYVRRAPYKKGQFGVSLGGPIVRDKLLFFVSSELQQRSIPARGAYVGEAGPADGPLMVSPDDIARFQKLLGARGLVAGSAGPITNANPSSSTFLRLDAPVTRWNSRISVRGSYGRADSAIFARPTMLSPTNCSTSACFPLSSLQHSRWLDKRSASISLGTNLPGGAYNELVAGGMHLITGFRPTVDAPLIVVSVPGANGMPAMLQAGTHEIATGQRNVSRSTEITDNLSLSAGPHRLTIGASGQLFDLWAFQLRGSFGIWEFASLDSLQNGVASRYRITRDTGSVTAASGSYGSIYLSDEWQLSSRLLVTLGVRADAAQLRAHTPYVAVVDSTFDLRTDRMPATDVLWSPRLGFNFDLTRRDGARTQVRGGAGRFTGRAPLFWLFGGFAAYGLAARTLQCGVLAGDAGPVPAFRPSFRDPPLACAGGQTFGPSTMGEIDVLDARLHSPQSVRASLAVDRELPLGFVGTIEGLYTRTTQAIFFAPLNLREPIGVDRHGRLLYGAIDATGIATPARIDSRLGDVVSITNQSRDNAYDVTAELRKQTRSLDVAISVSIGRARDIESPRTVSALLTDNWRYARPVAAREDALSLGTSDFDQPYRVRASGTLRSPWRAFPTEVSFFYVGGSGLPYTYVASGTSRRGDLNADGVVGNDPLYIPSSAHDTAEIQFAGSPADVASQQASLDRFIDRSACLRKQRGRIMARNSCRSPWMNVTNLAVRQAVYAFGARSVELEAQVFNVLNLLNAKWGRLAVPTGLTLATTSQIPLLSQVGESKGTAPQPIYGFDPTMSQYDSQNADSYYQLQFGIRCSF